MDVMKDLSLTERAMAAFAGILQDPGDSDTVMIDAGMTEIREGVTFHCNSDYDCEVMVSNNLGTIIATWSSQEIEGGMMAGVTHSMDPVPRDPMVVGGADRARPSVVNRAIDEANIIQHYLDFTGTDPEASAALTAVDAPPTANRVMLNKLVRDGDSSTFELKGDFVEMTAAGGGAAPMIKSDATDDNGGLMIMAEADGHDISQDDLDRWHFHSLERDWSHRLPDEPKDAPLYGGFETNALVADDIEVNKEREFEKLFTLNADGELEDISGNPELNGTLAMFMYDGQDSTYQNSKGANEDFRGGFAAVSGLFRCGDVCWLVKDKKEGTVSVMANDNGAPHATNFATLEFVPDDPEAMASVPDWAWSTYGAWLTTPQAMTGRHSIGMFATGGGVANALADTEYFAELEGTAEYKGVAIGYYVDGITTAATAGTAGTFSATATLTAVFDATDMLSGTISNFHDANGMEMSEFVVNLDAATMTNGAVAATAGTTSGHAKGVDWTGNWAGQLGGAPDANVEGLALDSTTAGTLLANIKDLSAAGVTTSYDDFPTGATGTFDAQNATSGVTGAFGAHLQPKPKE